MLRRIRHSSSYLAEMATDTFLVGDRDVKCTSCRQFYVCKQHQSFSLVSHDKVPASMRPNPYINDGFRPPELNWNLCLKSLFQLNNETINIWSHLFGFAYFTGCQLTDNIYLLPKNGASWDDHLIFSLSLLCFQICMLCSACFHLFNCLSETAYKMWLQLDLMGISMGLLGVYLSGVYYAFHCFPLWHNVWLVVISVLTLAALLGPFHRAYMTHHVCCRISCYHLVYAGIMLYGVVPTVQWISLGGGWHSAYVQRFLPNVVVLYGLVAVAGLFYFLMIPERWHPGRYDFIGWSHQWWHIFILGAMVWWRWSGLEHFTFIRSHHLPCSFVSEQ